MGNTWRMVGTGYRELIIMRHAKTEQSAGSDRARRLTTRGRADARAGGRWLDDNGLTPDVVLASPAARALATGEIVCAELSGGLEPRSVDELYGVSADQVVEILASTEPTVSSLLVVGHNPTMEDLAYGMQQDPDDAWAAHLPTAGLVVLRAPGEWADLAMGVAELTHWYVPRD